MDIKILRNITLIEKKDRSGTIILGSESGFLEIVRGTGLPMANRNMAPAIEIIENVLSVYRKISKLKSRK